MALLIHLKVKKLYEKPLKHCTPTNEAKYKAYKTLFENLWF